MEDPRDLDKVVGVGRWEKNKEEDEEELWWGGGEKAGWNYHGLR